MDARVTTFVNGRWHENCYLIADSRGDTLAIDPGSDAHGIGAIVGGGRLLAILNTHAHYDHIGAVAELMARYDVPFYLHGADERLLRRANLYRSVFESRDPVRIPAGFEDIAALPAEFDIGPFRIGWLPTPGHTEGSVCLKIGDLLFSGDTLLHGNIGRTDLPGGDRRRLLFTLRTLESLPGETVVYPGHGPATTIAGEMSPGTTVWSLMQ